MNVARNFIRRCEISRLPAHPPSGGAGEWLGMTSNDIPMRSRGILSELRCIRLRSLAAWAAMALLLLAASVSSHAGLSQSDMQSLLGEANHLFRQADGLAGQDPDAASDLYQKAIMRYERIINEGGVENGGLYYNIGNAYFRMKDIGRAVLNYRRAEQYIPNDPNLHQNLNYARARRLDRIEEPQRKKILKTLFFWHYDMSARMRSRVFAVCFVAVWFAAGVRLFVRRTTLSWVLAVCSLLAAAFLASLLVETTGRRSTQPGVVVSEEVIARKGDSETYEPSFKEPLHAGAEFELSEDRGQWYNIALADGRRCWVPARDVGLVKGR